VSTGLSGQGAHAIRTLVAIEIVTAEIVSLAMLKCQTKQMEDCSGAEIAEQSVELATPLLG
jgi:hypothetical protein